MDDSEILDKMLRNLPFYETGGITATGGEPLLQLDFLIELFSLAKKNGIHTALDTSGILFNKNQLDKYDRLMSVCDLVLLDIKHMDEKEHIRLTGNSNKIFERIFLISVSVISLQLIGRTETPYF